MFASSSNNSNGNTSFSSSSSQPPTSAARTDLDSDANMNNGVLNTVRQPDHDAIKMFVGQIPRSMDEAELRKMFEEFGEVYQINVLRDKMTGTSKGCCFVTFYTRKAALDAQNLLHNIKTLPGMHHPIQMKPADTENRLDRKLFLGMLSKRYSEQEVRMMFSQFGTIEDCSVLRDSNGVSKGCAFVTFSTRASAINAIRKLHHSTTMEGCNLPLVVKFADTPKEKDQKKMQQHSHNFWNTTSPSALAALGPHYLSLLQNIGHSPPNSVSGGGSAGGGGGGGGSYGGNSYGGNQHLGSLGGGGGSGGSGGAGPGLSQLGGISNMNAMQQLLAASQNSMAGQHQVFDASGGGLLGGGNGGGGGGGSGGASQDAASLQSLLASITSQHSGLTNLTNVQNLAALAALATANPSGLQALTQPGFPGGLGSPGLGGSTSSLGGTSGLSSLNQSNPAGKQIEGPPGANLFIYHLPQDFGDQDLAQNFWPFGKVISAKVFIDKQTNLSKCFGFVSYETAAEAQNAISGMNGQQIGNKRLKVQLKRPKDGRPY